MRILMVCDYLGLENPSGAGRYVLETGRSLRARGHEVRILAGGEPADAATDGKDGYPANTGPVGPLASVPGSL